MVTKPIMLDETGKRIATALETIAQNGGGSGGGGNVSDPYLISYYTLAKQENRHYNVDAIKTLIQKYNISTDITGGVQFSISFEPTFENCISYVYDSCAGGNKLSFAGAGSWVVDQNVTDVLDALTLKKTDIENATIYSLGNSSYIAVCVGGALTGDPITSITYSDFITIFKD